MNSQTDLNTLIEHLRKKHPRGVEAALFYGSCLRSGDLRSGVVDVYLIASSYRKFYSGFFRAAANRLLPPNVFYTEAETDCGQILRCKYAVVSWQDFTSATSTDWFQSYFWGRFCQPASVAWSIDQNAQDRAHRCLSQSAATLLTKAAPALPAEGKLADFWAEALALSYGVELRTEREGRARELIDYDLTHY